MVLLVRAFESGVKHHKQMSLISVYYCQLAEASGTCQFPDELQGVWHSSHKGNLTFDGNGVMGYPIQMSATVDELNFNCTEKDGDYYLLKQVYNHTLVFMR